MNDKEKFDYIYKSNLFDRQNQVNLLLLEKKHYVYIKNLFCIMHYSSDSSDSSDSDSS